MTRARVEKLIILAAAIALVVWIARNTYWTEEELPLPLKGEALWNPFYAAQRFSEELGATASWDPVLELPSTDGVVVLSRWHWDLSVSRRERLEQWVEAGGRLVVDRTVASRGGSFERWSGISRIDTRSPSKDGEEGEGEDEEALDEEEVAEVPPLLSGILPGRCQRLTEEGSRRASGATFDGYFDVCSTGIQALFTAREVDWRLLDKKSAMQVARVNIGRGSVTVINAEPFSYRGFLQGDHAALFAAASQLRPGDVIRFATQDEHPSILSLMWYKGWPAVCLALGAIALALWRGGARFGPLAAPQERARRSLAEQIRGTGRFAMRFGKGQALHAATVRALNEVARQHIRGYERRPLDERAAAVGRPTGLDHRALASALNVSIPRRPNELRSALALLEAARRRLSDDKQRSTHGNRVQHHHARR